MVTLRTCAPSGGYGTRLRLLELGDPAVLRAIQEQQAQGSVVMELKGSREGGEGEAVFCTKDETFLAREVRTSNTHLLICGETGEVREITGSQLDLARVPAKVEPLRAILAAHPYNGPEEEEKEGGMSRCRAENIFADTQASDREIQQTLAGMDALLLDGHYRILGSEYTARFLRLLLSTLTLHDLPLDGPISLSKLTDLLGREGGEGPQEEFPPALLHHLLRTYAIRRPDDDGTDVAAGTWQLDRVKTCRFYARELLRARPVWPAGQFYRAWERLCGELAPGPTLLRGLALTEDAPGDGEGGQALRRFLADELPLDASQRFLALFQARGRWRLSELEAYVEDSARALSIPTLDLIVKHCRISADPTGEQIVTPLLPV